ncbi:MAG: CPBP family intramembrane metalloprotease [Acidobacteriota bacterium]|nr:CPBP family intramembrane metalloprotease [Acidobacteriota bacterium]
MSTANTLLSGAADRTSMARVVYAALFLIASSAAFVGSFAAYDHHLIAAGHISASAMLDARSDVLAAAFSVVTLAVAILVTIPALRENLTGHTISLVPSAGWGLLAGLGAFLLVIPALLSESKHSPMGHYLANNLLTTGGASLLAIILVALPIASETFFRRILFWAILSRTSLVAALLTTTLLFVIVWPLFNALAALVLGAVTCILFYRTRSLFACIIADSFFTLSCAAFLLWTVLERT